ncbi:MAG: hypothetical protein IT210_20210 [Armatimonadetes bacterium]|nr:hypothetical protein [Armatimonadota bacterium]
MLRLIDGPTRARLDFAAYDRNILMRVTEAKSLTSPSTRPRMSGLTFGGALSPGTIQGRLAETPLTEAEKRSPLALIPLLDYLALWNYDASEKILLAAARVSAERWNNSDSGRPLQRLVTGYLHTAAGGTTELWAEVEFQPAVDFIEGVTDADGDGSPEVYGRVNTAAVTPAVVSRIRKDYMGRVLSQKELGTYFFELTSSWYPSLYTFLLKPNEARPWPNAATEPEVRAEMGKFVLQHPTAIIRGKPHDNTLYNVFVVTRIDAPRSSIKNGAERKKK